MLAHLRRRAGTDLSRAPRPPLRILGRQSTQRRLLDIASTLGISTSVLRLIERRNTQDWIILFAGMAVTVLIMYLALAYLR